MGWNSWNSGIALNEKSVEATIDAMVASGMRDAGYRYVNLDAGWAAPERDAAGNIQADPTSFPHGMAAIAAYAHDHGLLLGLYSSPYNQICGQTPDNASLGHEEADARTFATWGIDYLKYDWCGPDTDHDTQVPVFTAMRDALRHSGRDIFYSINPDSSPDPDLTTVYDWSGIADMSRIDNDLVPIWHNPLPTDGVPAGLFTMLGVTELFDAATRAPRHSGPGFVDDPDMLVVGIQMAEYLGSHMNSIETTPPVEQLPPAQRAAIGQLFTLPPDVLTALNQPVVSLTETEQRTHFSLWAMLAAPLIAGNDITTMSEQTRELLTNREVIAVDQDPLMAQGAALPGDNRVVVKPLADGSAAVALVNWSDTPATIETTATAVGLPAARDYTVRDLWDRTTTDSTGPLTASAVPPHGVVLLRVTPGR
ncbi:glycoside hydrolase family 27 protein [Nocardia stercoris]|uniref:Alpha-galactosidase n=2 Tax=Nocardia stercoris TaxID=2483361 RepID=A0A3M2L8G8_9NOCA|nr:glycoside hydrolase family 27 protein [Nocardia stercoris]